MFYPSEHSKSICGPYILLLNVTPMDESPSPDESARQILLLPRRRVRGPALTGDMAGTVRERWRLVWQPGIGVGFPPRREATPRMGTDRAAGAAHGEGREREPGARAPTGASAAARGARVLTRRPRWRGRGWEPSESAATDAHAEPGARTGGRSMASRCSCESCAN
jgi:hypothetical protein